MGDGEKKLQQGKSGKISSGHGKIVAPFPEIVEIGEGKQKKQKEKNGSAEKEGSRRKLPARKCFGKDFLKGKIGKSRQQKIHPGGKEPLQEQGKGRVAHPQVQSGRNMPMTPCRSKKKAAARSRRVRALTQRISPETRLNAPIRGQKILA